MATVKLFAAVSLDGFVADETDDVGPLFDWYGNGTEATTFSDSDRVFHVTPATKAYLDDTVVNWCPELGTVLANDEVKDGLSERGGYPVFQKKMRQWMMRITAYADRLEEGLDRLDWPASVKEMQRNWIGRSEGATVVFSLEGRHETIEVFTTRPDTIFGVSFIALSPEHELASIIATAVQRDDVKAFIDLASRKTERERMAGVETAGGIFTGARAIHPFTGEKLEVLIADYVLAGYGSGAVMGVPSGDQRDWNLAKNYSLPMIQVIDKGDITAGATEEKDVRLINSDFLTGMKSDEAIAAIIKKLELPYARCRLQQTALLGRTRSGIFQ